MSERFNIHDWQAKQRQQLLTEEDSRFPGEDEAGMAPRIGQEDVTITVTKSDQNSLKTLRSQIEQGTLDSKMRDEFVGLLDKLIDEEEEELEEANMTGTGASFNAGSGEGYATPNAFGDNKNKKLKTYKSIGYKEI